MMGEYFHGWRRKAGVVTLAMACVAMVAWVRSNEPWHSLNFYSSDNSRHYQVSLTPAGIEQNTVTVAGLGAKYTTRVVPHELIVYPLTVLSACLLLWPRKRLQQI